MCVKYDKTKQTLSNKIWFDKYDIKLIVLSMGRHARHLVDTVQIVEIQLNASISS